MEGTNKYGSNLNRHIAPLKLVSRLLSHEMHAQGGAKSISLSREEVGEIQTAIDLFIEEASRRAGGPLSSSQGAVSVPETHLVPARN